VLSCTNTGGLTVTAASGVASFTGCAITKTGTGYTLAATSSPALTAPVNANSFNITAGTATKLGFTAMPAGNQNATATATIGAYQVQRQDQSGNAVTAGGAITVNLMSNSAGTEFFSLSSGGAAGTAVTSVAIANNASTSGNFFYADTLAGTPTLTAHATGITNDDTTSPTITSGTASEIAFVNCSKGTGGTTCSGQPISVGNNSSMTANIAVVDQFGNVSTSAAGLTITLTSADTSNFTVTSSVTIGPGGSTSGQLTVTTAKNNPPTVNITAHPTSGSFSDIILQVKK
jgi:Flp pilus assembly protein TadG